MQGRLLPKFEGRYQAHPLGYWQKEFAIAKAFNLDCIEFILDFDNAELNPLLAADGASKIITEVESSDVAVVSVCADYFMEAPLHSPSDPITMRSCEILVKLIRRCYEIGVKDIVIPCVDQSSLVSATAVDRFVEVVTPMVKYAEDNRVNLCLETDLPPTEFAALLDRFGSRRITVNYDIGNSASLGYEPIEEFAAYGKSISDVHIKDRARGGGPTMLGTGDACFSTFFDLLERVDYRGPLIMQAYRDEEGVEVFREQLEWVKPFLPFLKGIN